VFQFAGTLALLNADILCTSASGKICFGVETRATLPADVYVARSTGRVSGDGTYSSVLWFEGTTDILRAYVYNTTLSQSIRLLRLRSNLSVGGEPGVLVEGKCLLLEGATKYTVSDDSMVPGRAAASVEGVFDEEDGSGAPTANWRVVSQDYTTLAAAQAAAGTDWSLFANNSYDSGGPEAGDQFEGGFPCAGSGKECWRNCKTDWSIPLPETLYDFLTYALDTITGGRGNIGAR
jgi:hypothetical protein